MTIPAAGVNVKALIFSLATNRYFGSQGTSAPTEYGDTL
jgi:hypothetical protein